uniref:Uncharacterized protein n=1 Tax=Oryza sativa subsp. japonica TaxID=39947 RepID=Q10NX5_ORYSJ|nr:hypothetical protein LOC_Os03g15029 [Oryza sativa Japonica Group]
MATWRVGPSSVGKTRKIPGSSNFFFRCFPADSKSLIGILHMDSRKDG